RGEDGAGGGGIPGAGGVPRGTTSRGATGAVVRPQDRAFPALGPRDPALPQPRSWGERDRAGRGGPDRGEAEEARGGVRPGEDRADPHDAPVTLFRPRRQEGPPERPRRGDFLSSHRKPLAEVAGRHGRTGEPRPIPTRQRDDGDGTRPRGRGGRRPGPPRSNRAPAARDGRDVRPRPARDGGGGRSPPRLPDVPRAVRHAGPGRNRPQPAAGARGPPPAPPRHRAAPPGRPRRVARRGAEEAAPASARLLGRLRATPGGALKARVMRRLIAVYRSRIGLREHPKYYVVRVLDFVKRAILEEGSGLGGAGL